MGVLRRVTWVAGELLRVRLLPLFFFVLLVSLAAANGFAPDRRKLLPVDKAPYRSLVRVWANNGGGSGVLVGPDLVLTVAHAVSDQQGAAYSKVEVESISGLRARVSNISMAPDWDPDPASGTDWALLRLDRPLGLRQGWVDATGQASVDEMQGLPVEFAGYGDCPEDLRSEFLGQPFASSGTIRDVGANIVFHDCSMWGGSSGGPLLAEKDGKWSVVAVNTAGVTVDDDPLVHGFRSRYSKETGNVGVPFQRWLPTLVQLLDSPQAPRWRTVYVRNRAGKPVELRARFRSAFAEADKPWVNTAWLRVPSGQRVRVVAPEDGLSEPSLLLTVRDLQGRRMGRKGSETVEVDGEQLGFYAFRTGEGAEITAFVP